MASPRAILGSHTRFKLLAAVIEYVVRDDVVVHRESEARGIYAGNFFHNDSGVAEVTGTAAVFLRHGRTQKSELTGLQPDFAWHAACFFPRRVERHDMIGEEAVELATKQFVFGS